MIQIVTLDEHNRALEHRVLKAPRCRRRAVELTPSMSVGDQIFIRADWPPIGSEDFAQRLREWHIAQSSLIKKLVVCPKCGMRVKSRGLLVHQRGSKCLARQNYSPTTE